jgi:hypothetical protein
MVDENDGTVYTLNTDQREIRSSNGEILMLSGEQFDAIQPEFLGTVEADQSVPGLESIPPDNGGCVPSPGLECPLVVVRPPDLSLIQWRFASREDMRDGKRSKGKNNNGGRDHNLVDITSGRVTAMLNPPSVFSFAARIATSSSEFAAIAPVPFTSAAYSDPMCTQVANAALPSTIDWRGQRTSLVKDGFFAATAIVVGGVAKKILAGGTLAASKFLSSAVERADIRVRMQILAFYWNSYNCSSQVVTAGPIWMQGSNPSSGGGIGRSCAYDYIQISFNDGATWSTIYVMVCYAY